MVFLLRELKLEKNKKIFLKNLSYRNSINGVAENLPEILRIFGCRNIKSIGANIKSSGAGRLKVEAAEKFKCELIGDRYILLISDRTTLLIGDKTMPDRTTLNGTTPNGTILDRTTIVLHQQKCATKLCP